MLVRARPSRRNGHVRYKFGTIVHPMRNEDKDLAVTRFIKFIAGHDKAIELLTLLVEQEKQGAAAQSEPELYVALEKRRAAKLGGSIHPKDEVKMLEEVRQSHAEGGSKRGVARAMKTLRDKAEEFSGSSEARSLPIEIGFASREYRINFTDREPWVTSFWKPYLETADQRDLLIVYPEHVFFRNVDGRYFVRHLDLNDIAVPYRELKKKMAFLPEAEDTFQPARPFVSSGDVAALLHITLWFARRDVYATSSVAHQTLEGSFEGKNVVIIGNVRTYPAGTLERLLWGFNFEVRSEGVVNRKPCEEDPESAETLDGLRFYRDEFRAPGYAQGVLFRMVDDDRESAITVISSNTGRFSEAVARATTVDKTCKILRRGLMISETEPFPDRFELYLHTDVPGGEYTSRPSSRVEPKAKRVYGSRASV